MRSTLSQMVLLFFPSCQNITIFLALIIQAPPTMMAYLTYITTTMRPKPDHVPFPNITTPTAIISTHTTVTTDTQIVMKLFLTIMMIMIAIMINVIINDIYCHIYLSDENFCIPSLSIFHV